MLRTPSLVSFSGSCTHAGPFGQLAANNTPDKDLGEVELPPPWSGRGELRLADERAAPLPVEEFTAGITANAADTMAMLAEHRVTRPMSLRSSREARILTLVDAIFATGEHAGADVLGWWNRARDESPWTLWPPVFLLGLLDGPDGMLAIERLIEALGHEDDARVEVAANALAVVPHPSLGALAPDLLESESPLARAIGLEVLSRRGEVSMAHVALHLNAAAPALLAAALRALVRFEKTALDPSSLLPFLRHRDPGVAWEAARAMTLRGAPDALLALREGQGLGATLGARAVELFVMAGEAADITRIEAIVASAPMSSELLDAIGRFGNPLAWSFLLHFLADRELGDAAELALFTLFGPLVPPEAARNSGAWRDALAERDLDPAMRYRCGEPWSPALVLRDCGFGEPSPIGEALSQRALERRLDELGARTGMPTEVDLAVWGGEAATKLRKVVEGALRVRWRPGAWNVDRRNA